MPKMFSPSAMFFKKNFPHKNMKKPASKVAEPAQIQPKSQFLLHKNLPPWDFSTMTLHVTGFKVHCQVFAISFFGSWLMKIKI